MSSKYQRLQSLKSQIEEAGNNLEKFINELNPKTDYNAIETLSLVWCDLVDAKATINDKISFNGK